MSRDMTWDIIVVSGDISFLNGRTVLNAFEFEIL
jgi:hypothetical protein